MRLSYSLKKNILETSVGKIVNKFGMKKRRNIFFFDEIPLNYIRECEKEGYGKDIRDISRRWFAMILKQILPDISRITPGLFFNLVLSRVWKNMGYMESITLSKKGDRVEIRTRNELNVKNIGLNNLSIGTYMGTLNTLYGSEVEFIDGKNRNGDCLYVFRLTGEPFSIETRSKKEYERMNSIPEIRGFTLKDAVRSRLFTMRGNKLYFRGRGIGVIENTLFHLLGNAGILLERVPQISYRFFRETLGNSRRKENLVLLKTVLQTMGWGIIIISSENHAISVEIKNPPHGFQKEKDNWNFLVQAILGYLWVMDRKFRVRSIETGYRKLLVKYSV